VKTTSDESEADSGSVHQFNTAETSVNADDSTTTVHSLLLTLYVHIKTAEQRTIKQQYGDWYSGR